MPVTAAGPSTAALAAAARLAPTPFYCYDAAAIRARYAALKAALPKGWNLFYAAKANPNVAVLRLYRALGAVAECASAGEMLACHRAGFKPENMALSGPVKTERELALVKRRGIRMVHAETVEELAALEKLGRRVNVALRINIDLRMAPKKAGRVMTGGKDKFGFSPAEAARLLAGRGMFRNVVFCGFHMYMGTQVKTSAAWIGGARVFMRYVAAASRAHGFFPIYVNFGGGLGIPYKEGDTEFDLKKFAAGLKRLAAEAARDEHLSQATFQIEPGRWLMGPCGAYVMTVQSVKEMRGARFALTDGGIHHALFPFRISREFPAEMVKGKGGKPVPQILGGPLCTTLDQSDLPVRLPPLRAGDVIAIRNSGAYGYGTGMHYFLSHPLPAEILKEGGRYFLIREASPSGHIFRHQVHSRLKK